MKLGLACKGRWHVVYGDGRHSVDMPLSVALGYEHIFKGRCIETQAFGLTISVGPEHATPFRVMLALLRASLTLIMSYGGEHEYE